MYPHFHYEWREQKSQGWEGDIPDESRMSVYRFSKVTETAKLGNRIVATWTNMKDIISFIVSEEIRENPS